ncbi:adenylate kinase [Candidatus Falkowbacteria bacterium]|nr:adenylate kinase [Candidatus Falkowbacteria bacterium]
MFNLNYKNIIIFGPQASGKGTQADVLAEKFGVPHISTGAIFRDEIRGGTELGKKVEGILNAGNLVPDEITNEIVKNRLSKSDCSAGFVLEGYPRNISQAGFLDKVAKVDLALEVWISDEEAVMRIGGRRNCPKCGTPYHLKFNPSKKEGVCDKDGEKLIIRDDESDEIIKQRLKNYHEQTEPIIDFYKERGIYKKIDGMPSISEVTSMIMKVVEE